MRIPKYLSFSVSIFMSGFLTNLPSVAAASAATPTVGKGMITTVAAVEELNRAEAQKRVQSFLDRDDVKRELQNRGLSADEASVRLANLSDSELRQLTGQMEKARAGGDILIAILVVVLIIFLIKRI